MWGWLDVVEQLLEKGPLAVAIGRTEKSTGSTPLALAAQFGHADVAEALLAESEDAGLDIPRRDGRTPLILAVRRRDHKMLRMLLEFGADPNLAEPGALAGGSPLKIACQLNDDVAVNAILDFGAERSPTSTSECGVPRGAGRGGGFVVAVAVPSPSP